MCGILFIVGHCYGKESFYAHDAEEEKALIEFVRNHPEIDFSTYATNGMPILKYVTLCNYTNFLVFAEDTRGAIRAYKPIENEPTLLECAMVSKLQEATDYLASVRPDWVFEGGANSAISGAMLENNVQQVQKFLDLGVDVNAHRGAMGFMFMDIARNSGMDMYELLRSRGARFGWEKPFSATLRQGLFIKYSGDALNLYTNALAQADGARIDFAIDADGNTISKSSLTDIEGMINTVGARCNGTILMIFHTPNAEPANFHMEEIVDRANVAVVRIPAGMESSPDEWPMEYLPYIPPDN